MLQVLAKVGHNFSCRSTSLKNHSCLGAATGSLPLHWVQQCSQLGIQSAHSCTWKWHILLSLASPTQVIHSHTAYKDKHIFSSQILDSIPQLLRQHSEIYNKRQQCDIFNKDKRIFSSQILDPIPHCRDNIHTTSWWHRSWPPHSLPWNIGNMPLQQSHCPCRRPADSESHVPVGWNQV